MSEVAGLRGVSKAMALVVFFVWGCGLPAPETAAEQAPAVAVASSFDPWHPRPSRQRDRDPSWEAYRNEVLKDTPEVENVVSAYEALVFTHVELAQLPLILPGTRPNELFTIEEVESRLPSLPVADAAKVREAIAVAEGGLVKPDRVASMRWFGLDVREPDRLLLNNPGEICWGMDIISIVAESESLAINARLDVRSLTDQALFAGSGERPIASPVPSKLQSLVADELRRLKEAMPWRLEGPNGRPEVRLRFQTPIGTGLWIDVDAPLGATGIREMRVSPPLVRALFVQTLRQIAPHIVQFLQLRSSGTYRQFPPDQVALYLLPTMLREAREVDFCFRRSLSFGIGHELAHAWLGAELEEDADEAARNLLEEVYGDSWLGFFDSLLLRAVLEDAPETWALEHPAAAALRSRLERLRSRLPASSPTATRCERGPYARRQTVTDFYTTERGCVDAREPKATWCGLLTWGGNWVRHGSYESFYPGPGERRQAIGTYDLDRKTGDWYYWSETGAPTRHERFHLGTLLEESIHDLAVPAPSQGFAACPEIPQTSQ